MLLYMEDQVKLYRSKALESSFELTISSKERVTGWHKIFVFFVTLSSLISQVFLEKRYERRPVVPCPLTINIQRTTSL